MTEKLVALFDVDKTVYEDYVIFPLAELQAKEGIITANSLEQVLKDKHSYEAKEIDYQTFARDAMRHWAIGLIGRTYSKVLSHTEIFLRSIGYKFFPYFGRVVELLSGNYDIYLVTAEPQFVTAAIQKIFSISGYAASEFELVNGVFTGKADILASSQDKSTAINSLLGGRSLEKSFGFGDSGSDIEMLEMVNFPICTNPNEALREYATNRGWSKFITNPDGVESLVKSLLV